MTDDIHASKTKTLFAANITLILLSGIAVALRLLSRKLSKIGLWYDDYVIIIAMPLAWMLAIVELIATHFDFGKHEAVARPDAVEKWYLMLYIFENIYAPAIAMVKFSILLFYARIFTEHTAKMLTQVWFRRALYAMGTVTFAWWITCQFFVIFECTPIHYFWDRKPITGHCQNVQKFFRGQAVPNIITDFVLLVLPLPLIWRLHLPTEQKVALSGVFLLGGFVTATSIYRLTLLVNLTQVDITWNYADSAVWSAVEPNAAVISACLPMLRPVVRFVADALGRVGSKVSLRKSYRHTASTVGFIGKKPPALTASTVPSTKDSRPFARLARVLKYSDWKHEEEWELWEGRGSKDVQRMNSARRADRKDMLGQAELGAVPRGAILVRNEIFMRYDKSMF